MKKIIKTDAELIFDTNKVYKRFTTQLVGSTVLNDLIRLDKLANVHPHFMGVLPYRETPFCTEELPDATQILVMEYLPEQYFLTKITERNELTEDILQKMANTLYEFHIRVQLNSEALGRDYLLNRFLKDKDLILAKVKLNATAEEYYKNFIRLIDINSETIRNRLQNKRIVEGHGDLNLDHIHFHNGIFTFIDFSHNTKYRFDDSSRDVAGIYLHLVELGRKDFATTFLNKYCTLSKDTDLKIMVNLQVAKKILVKYFVYAGGFDPKHYDKKLLQSVISTIEILGNTK